MTEIQAKAIQTFEGRLREQLRLGRTLVSFLLELIYKLKFKPRNERRQTMLFSATKDNKTNELVKLALKSEPMEVDVDADKINATVEDWNKQKQVKPYQHFYQFCNAESGILLCTGVFLGWDIPAVDWIVQYDPPDDPKSTFIGGEELPVLVAVAMHSCFLRERDWLEKLMTQNYFLHASGKEAFKGYVRAYNSHQQKDVLTSTHWT
ncbi:ATP-dependent RNA helicase DDX18-like [Homarus americanus]|uniref:ATP-dependent RNA helicase DDX18-like n=1 Tax=Homarus americanus TaxID=6706 RepID=UPI001C47BA7C|nr:ATP-dependent RNA helicase DDX18-like [Homarus americanus]XP_042241711.1 ATP-dependent RNA helicase DDX18-like [Homarus americanus]